MSIIIREENKNDYNNIEIIVERAFKDAENSDKTEHKLVEGGLEKIEFFNFIY